jgi:hypothetical protein
MEQTLQCETIQPWLAAYALGDADDDSAARAHLEVCLSCQASLREYRGVAGLIGYVATEAAPPIELRERIVGAVATAAGQPLAQTPAPRPQPQPERARWRLQWPAFSRAAWAAVAFAMLSLGLLFWNVTLQGQINAQSAQLAESGKGWQSVIMLLNDASLRWYSISGDQANGRFWTTPQSQEACLIAQHLPDLPANEVYQVWLTHDGKQIDGGTFEAHNGNAWVIVQSGYTMASYNGVFVTIEPAGGSAWPTGQRVLTGALSGGTTASAADRQALALLIQQ